MFLVMRFEDVFIRDKPEDSNSFIQDKVHLQFRFLSKTGQQRILDETPTSKLTPLRPFFK